MTPLHAIHPDHLPLELSLDDGIDEGFDGGLLRVMTWNVLEHLQDDGLVQILFILMRNIESSVAPFLQLEAENRIDVLAVLHICFVRIRHLNSSVPLCIVSDSQVRQMRRIPSIPSCTI